MIELQGLEKRYGAQLAVADLTVTFPAGQITALLGPSGCGKTTTLRMINRLIEPTGGSVRVDGQDVRAVRPEVLRRGIGYVIQRIGLFPHLSVARNIATVPELLGWPRARVRARVDELLDLVGLEPGVYRDKRPAELSGGQAQRVGVARALAADPPVLLMDEPFGALDPIARAALQAKVVEIQRRLHKTVVMVTHDINEALVMADMIALMNAGRLEQFGTPDDLVRRPASAFVAQFMGEDAALEQLGGVLAANVARPGDAAGLPVLPAGADARAALALMLRHGTDAVAVEGGAGVVQFRDLMRDPRASTGVERGA
ncbi:ABC transporter ATP-binding protein [Deinococcus maricopensis]|uniref:Fe(3+)-transporting ATPase n=1 Tax=Deinococcus maricopensis (strain DSM 21211 / LMG 22137 / NRRL B-23946 / LB-34) TaxID=709986 RepID=E8U6K3_DEIML|nr:ABC transporter ATP-binding protein [Deinococcus maricopensis]ADV66692.1 Fe(3+)-transporting ATPase [Deinococcus maricopensis DSM 21211]